MPGWQSEETPLETQVATLKRQKQTLEDRLTDRDNELATAKDLNRDLEKEVREANYRAQHEAREAAQAHEALNKKTAAYNNLKIQKDNAESALFSHEATIKEREAEIKKLTCQLEVNSARSATAANAKVADEKAALEKRVHALTMELQRVQLEREKDRENHSASSPVVATEPKSSLAGSKIARPPSRSSIAPSDTSRSRFGFQPTGPTTANAPLHSRASSASDSQPSAIRPPSALSSHAAIPGPSKLPSRRPSVSKAPAPAGVNTSSVVSPQKIAQLENSLSSAQSTITELTADLKDAQSTVETLDNTLEATREQLSKKKDELLRVENQLMALERSSEEEKQTLRDEIDEARQDVEVAREEAREVREELERELAAVAKGAERDKAHLEERYNDLVSDLESLESELERNGGEREDLSRMLKLAREELAEAEDALKAKEEERVDLENELAYLEETHDEALEAAKDKRRELEAEIDQLRHASARVKSQEAELEGLEGNREELERHLQDARNEVQQLKSQLDKTQAVQSALEADLESHARRLDDRERELEELRAELGRSSTSPASDSQSFTARIAILEAEVFKKESEVDSLGARLSQFQELASAHEQLVEEAGELARELDAKTRELAGATAQVEELEHAHSSGPSLAREHEDLAKALQETVSTLTNERDDLQSKAAAHSDDLEALRAELDRLRSIQSRSYSDDQVADLERSLEDAREEAKTLRARLDELEHEEWASDRTSKDLQDRIESLEAQVAELGDQLESERGSTIAAELEVEAVQKTLRELQEHVESVEGLLDSETKARERAEDEKLDLENQLAEHGSSEGFSDQGHVEELEREIDQLQAQLDDVRANAEDDSYAHLQEITDLQLRLRGQETQIEDLQRELTVCDALRHILGETEARVDSLGWDLKAAHSVAAKQRAQAVEELEAVNKRFEASEEECLRLRAELDDTRHKLSNAQDALDQARADLATPPSIVSGSDNPEPTVRAPSSPLGASPTSQFFGLSPGPDPSILVTRLREERDELRSRLDFARTEADFRVKALQKRLEDSEQNKARELSIMEVDLLDKSAALDHELDTNAKIDEALRSARAEKVRIEDELSLATKELGVATRRVDEFEAKLREAERLRVDQERDRESVWALEGELSAATKSADAIRSQLESATASNTELNKSLDSLRADLRAAEAELDRQQVVAADSVTKIASLEAALADARAQDETRQSAALAEFATLCESLESDVTGLRTRIAEQDALIKERERSISLLQLGLAVRIAIEDDDDLSEEADDSCSTTEKASVRGAEEEEEAADDEDAEAGDRTIAVEPSLTPSHLADLELRLSEELATRLELEHQLAALQGQLDGFRADHSDSITVLEEELTAARLLADEERERARGAAEAFADLEQQRDRAETERESLTQTVAALRLNLSELENAAASRTRAVADSVATIEAKEVELETANRRIATLEAALEEAKLSAVKQERVAALEAELAQVESRLSDALSSLDESNERAQASQALLDALESKHAALAAEYDAADSGFKTEVSHLEQQVAEAREVSVQYEQAQRRITVLEEQLAVATESLSTTRGADVDSAEEISTLSRRHEEALDEARELSAQLEAERFKSASALAAADAAAQSESETSLKAQAAGDRAVKEIQTLRQLGRASQVEAETLSAEIVQLRMQIGQLEAQIEMTVGTAREDVNKLKEEKERAIEEMVVCLETYENKIRELEESASDKETRIEQLEQSAQGQLEEIDEANDNLIEALKVQKKYGAQIERLKSKIATLQRDLVLAKSSPPPPLAPVAVDVGASTTSTSAKKRRAPEEFDPSQSSSGAPVLPRAIVASSNGPQSLRTTKANLRDGGNENTVPERRSSLTRTKVAATNKGDSTVPLKAGHEEQDEVVVRASMRSSRPALGTVDGNAPGGGGGDVVLGKPTSTGARGVDQGGNAKLDALKAKLAAQKKRTRSGLSAGTN